MFSPLLDSLIFFVAGLVFGSFGNVCIHRIPLDQSVNNPKRSYCPKCKYAIPWYLNIPVVGWIILRGRCASCSMKISIRYPIIEILVGISFVLVFRRYDWSWTAFEYCILAWGLIISSTIDLDHMILPDVFTLSGIVLGLIGGALNPERLFLHSFIGFLIGGGILYFISYVFFKLKGVEGMGGGDIKLLGWIGAYLGWQSLMFTLMFSSLVGALVGIVYLKRSGQSLQTGIPFGPFLSAGALIYMLFDVQPVLEFFRLPFFYGL